MTLPHHIWIGLQGSLAAAMAALFSMEAMTLPKHQEEVRAARALIQPVQSPQTTPSSQSVDPIAGQALRAKIELLERGQSYLASVSGYSADFHKQEMVNGELQEKQSIFLKCRHQPFSVYLLWLEGDAGREVLYVDGQNGNKLLVHDGGWKSRLPALSLSPECSLAMSDSRYPVTKAGLQGLIEIMLTLHRHDLAESNYAQCVHQENVEHDGQVCDLFTLIYKSRDVSPTYRKSVTLIDRKHGLPLSTHHYEWAENGDGLSEADLDQATLIESYEFSNIDFNSTLKDTDFASNNEEYQFR